MRKKKSNKGQQAPDKPPSNMFPENVENSKTKEVGTSNDKRTPNQNNECPEKIIYVENRDKGMNSWNKVSVIINGLIMLFTGFLFWQNIKNIKAATKSANFADSTFREVKKQFEVLNRPILQIGDIALAKFQPGEKPLIIYKLENLGNFAAKVLSRKIRLGYVFDIRERKNDSGMIKIEIPIYVSKEIPFVENLPFNDPVGKEYYDAVIKGTLKLLVYGEIEYINEVTKENWRFEFAIQIMPPPSKDFRVYIAENTPPK